MFANGKRERVDGLKRASESKHVRLNDIKISVLTKNVVHLHKVRKACTIKSRKQQEREKSSKIEIIKVLSEYPCPNDGD